MNLEYRPARPYMVICRWVTRDEIPATLPPLIGEVADWLKRKMVKPEGPPFFEYRVMTGNRMHVCVGFQVGETVEGDDDVHAGAFPEGEYATAMHCGPYEELFAAHQQLDQSFQALGYTHRILENVKSVSSGSRSEFYMTDPAQEPDPKKWRTEIAVWVRKA